MVHEKSDPVRQAMAAILIYFHSFNEIAMYHSSFVSNSLVVVVNQLYYLIYLLSSAFHHCFISRDLDKMFLDDRCNEL